MKKFLLIPLALLVTSVFALRIEDVEEGGCPQTGFPPVPDNDWSFINNLTYFTAASRHYLYAMASSHPRFTQMNDYELREHMCLTHNVTLPSGRGSAIGFGGHTLGTYQFGPKTDQQSVFDLSFVPSGGVGALLQPGNETITLTDYKTFAFFANCFIAGGSEQKSWILISHAANLSPSTRTTIASHALSLGFDPKNFVFLNYDNCGEYW